MVTIIFCSNFGLLVKLLLDTDTGTSIIYSIILAKEILQNKEKIKINLKIIIKDLYYHLKSCLPEISIRYSLL
jgi:hypothetical protein